MGDATAFVLNAGEISSSLIDGEAVIINLSSGVYYSAAGSAALAFALLQQGETKEAVASALAARFGISGQQATGDLEPFIGQLLEEDILVPGQGPAAATGPVEVPDGPYAAPVLEKYADMSDLLSLDPPMPGIEDIPWEKPEV